MVQHELIMLCVFSKIASFVKDNGFTLASKLNHALQETHGKPTNITYG